MIKSLLKEKMDQELPVIGTWNTLGSSLVSEVLASSGLDFIIIDFEHGPFELAKVSDYVNASCRYQCTPIVRIPDNQSWMSLQALDLGAQGIIIPGVNNKIVAQNFADQIKYKPLGRRGFSPFTKAGRFNNKDANYQKSANSNTTTIIIIEDIEGINNLDEILEIETIDIVYFGAYDLSQDLEIAGDLYNDKLTSLIIPSIKKVLNAKKYAGGFVPQTLDEIKKVRDFGINFITYNVDSFSIYNSYKEVVDWFDNNK